MVRDGTEASDFLLLMRNPIPAASPTDRNPTRERILGAAFEAFTEEGYADVSTLDIARRAKVSKRDLYANFASKRAVLTACIAARAERIGRAASLPVPENRGELASTLDAFAINLLREISHPTVIAVFRLAIAEAASSPEIARTLDTTGRAATRETLAGLLTGAQSAGLLGPGDLSEMVQQYLGLLWEGLMIELMLGVAPTPSPAEIEQRAKKATVAFLRLYPDPAEPR